MQDDKVKLTLLVEMVKALNKRVDLLAQMNGFSKAKRELLSEIDCDFQKKIKDIEKSIE